MDTDPRAADIERFYVHCRFGQVHGRRLNATGSDSSPPLICLHPAPYSGLYFTTAMPLLNENRCVIAPDYPGYGGSTPLVSPPSISDFAIAVIEMIDALAIPGDQAVDLLGFHTGCLVAAEIAIQEPSIARRLVLVDVPYFDSQARHDLYEKMAQPGKVTQLSDLDANWDFNITNRLDAMSFERAFDLFAEQLRPAAISHWGFHAAFTWPGEERLPLVMTETLVIATDSGLSEATHLAATILPNAQLHTKPDIKRAVFEQAAGTIADETIDWLDR